MYKMLVTEDSVYGLSLERIWCWNGEKIVSNADVLRYLRILPGLAEKINGIKCFDVNHTLITDLTEDEETIWSKLNKNYKYEIRRQQKEEAQFYVYSADMLKANPSVVAEFEIAYNAFCDEIHNEVVRGNYNHNMTLQFVDKDALVLTKATKDNLVVYHIYVIDGKTAVLDYSVSDFRDESADRAAAGRLNKLLHWRDMQMFKADGYVTYDWGNVSGKSVDEMNGIDKFKAGFGGELTKQVSVFVGNSLKGSAAVIAKRMLKR